MQYGLSQESNLAPTIKQRKKMLTMDGKYDLHVVCAVKILKRVPDDSETEGMMFDDKLFIHLSLGS